jgi:mycothiol synthase
MGSILTQVRYLRANRCEYHSRGIKRVALSVDAESVTGAPRLYSRAGMHVTNNYFVYQRELRPGVDVTVRP